MNYKKHDSIPTEEILKDKEDTQKEIDQYIKELEALKENMHINRLPIYLREGKIATRETFIEDLNGLLKYRKEKDENNI